MTGNNGMMESERPHRTGSTSSSSSSSELFICFTSRLSSSSSSSMKLSSKSILSPGRTGDPPVSFSNSLSCRRLRSMKGGQASPMFPTGSKKRGGCAAFENPEPSSPKVTCIGQVRVKTKKRTLSKRRGVSTFRKVDHQQSLTGREGILNQYQQQECLPHRNQRWVHLPLTICEALRTFGAEFSCLFPCRSSSDQREKAAGLVVAGDEEEERTLRRHAMIEIRDETYHEEEEARVSICIPPKNALLLMRCRSDPIRMAALANRFWDSPAPPIDEDDDDDEEVKALIQGEMKDELRLMEEKKDQVLCEKLVSNEEQENHEAEEDTLVVEEVQEEDKLEIGEEFHEEHLQVTQSTEVEEGNVLAGSSSESLVDHETVKNIEEQEPKQLIPDEAKEDSHCDPYSSSSSSIVSVLLEVDEDEAETLAAAAAEKSTVEKETQVRLLEDEQKVTQERFEPEVEEEDTKENHDEEHDTAAESEEERESHVEVERESAVKKQERESSVLPDCLLLMMCEPKLSMEVSRETWVCSTDFIRWQPAEKQVNLMDGGDEPKKRLISTAAHHGLPPRSSCSLPAPAAAVACVSMARMIEQKLVNAVAYEPLVLTRCKSEPMRTAAKLAPPESCFWKNRKLEPHRRARFGISAAGVGF